MLIDKEFKEFEIDGKEYVLRIDVTGEIGFYRKKLIIDRDFHDEYYIYEIDTLHENESAIKLFRYITKVLGDYVKIHKPHTLMFRTGDDKKNRIYRKILKKVDADYQIVEYEEFTYAYKR